MTLEEKIIKIVDKVRTIFKYDIEKQEIIKTNPSISLEYKNNELNIVSIEFNYYDILCITPTKVIFIPEFGNKKILFKYDNYDELLNL